MRRIIGLLGALSLAGCPGKGWDSGADDTGSGATCCSFSCSDGTNGQVSFTVSDSDCDDYADEQCSLSGSGVTTSDYSMGGC